MNLVTTPAPSQDSVTPDRSIQKTCAESPLFTRHALNPILSRENWPYPINTAFNPGVARLSDGSTLLLCRVEDRRGFSHFCAARSRNGIDGWRIDPQPTLQPDPSGHPEELWGIEDARITYVPEHQAYYIAYTAYSRAGPEVSLARTTDFAEFERLGAVMPPEDKDAALMPYRLGNRWALIHRPMGPDGAHIWLSYSSDLEHWSDHRRILAAREGSLRVLPDAATVRSAVIPDGSHHCP